MEDRTEGMRTGRPSLKAQAIAFLLAALLLYLALRGADWGEMVATVRQGNANYLPIVCIIFSASLFLRGIRWRVLLSAERNIAPLTVFWATAVGYLGNLFLPARAGELIRSVFIGRVARVSKSLVFATALSERVIDAVALVAFGLIAAVTLHDLPDWLTAAIRVMGVAGLIGIAGLVAVSRLERLVENGLRRLPLPGSLAARLSGMSGQFLLGMRSFQDRSRAVNFVMLTIVIWLVDGVGTVVAATMLNLPPLNLLQALLLLVGLGLSSAIPSTPGYVGVYQFVAVTILPLFAFSQSQALTYIVVVQAMTYLVVIVWGLLGLWRLSQNLALARQVSG